MRQSKIIKSLNRFLKQTEFNSTHLKLNEKGICAGLVAIYLAQKLKGTENEFLKDIKKIISLKKEDYAKEKAFAAKFCQKVLFAFMPHLYKKNVRQGDIDKIMKDPDGGALDSIYKLGIPIELNQLESIMLALLHNHHVAYLHANGHAIGVAKKYNKYYLYDPNNKKQSEKGEKKYISSRDFANEIPEFLLQKPKDQTIKLRIHVLNYQPKQAKINNPSKYPSKEEFADKISTVLDPNYYESLFHSTCIDDAEMVSILLKRSGKPFSASSPDTTPFFIACYLGRAKIVDLMLTQSSESPKEDVLESALYSALEEGQKAVCDSLLAYLKQNKPALLESILLKAFLFSCRGGDIEIMKTMIAIHPRIIETAFNVSQLFGKGPLIHAAKNGHPEAIKFLIQTYPNLLKHQQQLEFAILEAIQGGHYSCFIELTKHVSALNDSMLQTAIEYHQDRMVEEFIKRKINITFNHVQTAIQQGNEKILRLLLANNEHHHPADKQILMLIQKAIDGDLESLRSIDSKLAASLLIFASVNENHQLYEALFSLNIHIQPDDTLATKELISACREGNLPIIEALVKAGVDSHQAVIEKDEEGKDQNTFPALIALEDNPEITLWLLKHAGPFSDEHQNKLMRIACEIGCTEIVNELIKQHFDINRMIGKLMPLEIATKYNQPEVIELLLKQGANPTFSTDVAKNILLPICRKGHIELVKKILSVHPELGNRLPQEEIAKFIAIAAKNGGYKGIDSLCHLQPIPRKILDGALEIACQYGHADAVNVLLKHGAKFTADNYTEKLLKAYQDVTSLENTRGDIEIMQLSSLFEHKEIYHYVHAKRKYLVELSHQNTARIELNAQINSFSSSLLANKGQRSKLFHFDADKVLRDACLQGNMKVIKQLMKTKKVDISKQQIDVIDLASSQGHKDLVAFFVTDLIPFAIESKLRKAASEKNWLTVASILEVLTPNQLPKSLLADLLKFQFDIRNAFNDKLLYQNSANMPRDDANERKMDVTTNKNALGILLHKPLEKVAMGQNNTPLIKRKPNS